MEKKTLFFDCKMGAAGDMITAALLDLMENPEAALEELNGLGIPEVKFELERTERCGIVGNHVKVLIDGRQEPDDWKVGVEDEHEHHHEHGHGHHHEHGCGHHGHHAHDHHEHRSLDDIREIINGLNISEKVKEDAFNVYALIAEAESKAHGHPVADVHFHEVGRMDAIADVVAGCYLLEKLAPEKIIASPVAVGNGYVRCAHGVMAVPAPATLHILQGVPIFAGEIPTESCTPTGAALLKHFVDEFEHLPTLAVSRVGYGMGSRIFPGIASALRTFLGE